MATSHRIWQAWACLPLLLHWAGADEGLPGPLGSGDSQVSPQKRGQWVLSFAPSLSRGWYLPKTEQKKGSILWCNSRLGWRQTHLSHSGVWGTCWQSSPSARVVMLHSPPCESCFLRMAAAQAQDFQPALARHPTQCRTSMKCQRVRAPTTACNRWDQILAF